MVSTIYIRLEKSILFFLKNLNSVSNVKKKYSITISNIANTKTNKDPPSVMPSTDDR